MQVKEYYVLINEGEELENGQVLMQHDTQYTLCIINSKEVNVDAEIKIDGKVVGLIRLKPLSTVIIDKGTEDKGKFTFYANDTDEFYKTELDSVDKDELGLITVTFYPEKFIPKPRFASNSYGIVGAVSGAGVGLAAGGLYSKGIGKAVGSRSFNSGGTGLSGTSNQHFRNAPKIDYDYNNVCQINLRLVEGNIDNHPRPLKGIKHSNPIPPTV